MSGMTSRQASSHKILVTLWVLAILIPVVTSHSSDAQEPVSETASPAATPSLPLRSRIDIGPISELNPISRIRRNDDEERSEFMHLIADPNGVLAESHASELADDAHRLTVHGIPTMIILRESDQSVDESARFADRLRREKRLETAPGADDGILFLLTQEAGTSRQSMFLTISVGTRTLPKGGLNDASLQDVFQRSMRPRLRFGLIAEALRVGIRKIIYLETYHPDPLPPLTSLQRDTRAVLTFGAPAFSLAAIVSVIAAWRSVRPGSRWRKRRERRRYGMDIGIGSAVVIFLAAVSVFSRSEPGILAVIVGVAAIFGHVHLLGRTGTGRRPPARRLEASAHVAGSRRVRRKPERRPGPVTHSRTVPGPSR